MSALGFKRVVAITTSIMLLLLQATPAEGLVNTNAFSDGNDSHPVLTKSVNDQENDTVDEQKKLSGAKTLADTIGFQMNNAAASAVSVPMPTVTATEPTTDGEVKLSGSVTAGYWVYYSFDGKTFMLADSTTSDETWSKVVTLPRSGNNTIYVYSKKSNYQSGTATINVAFTVPKPTVSATEPTTDGEVKLSGFVTAGYWVYYSFDGKTFMLADSTTSDGTWSKVVTLPRIGNNTIYVYSKKSNFRSETATINVAFTVPKPTVSVTEPTTDGEVTLSGSVTAGYWVYYSFDGKTFTLADSTTSHGTWSKEVALPKTGAVVVYIYAQKAKYQSEVVRLDVSLVSPEMLARAQAILGPDVLTGRKTNSKTPEYLFYDKNGNLVGRLLQPVRTESQDEWYNALGQLVAEIKKDGSKRLYSYQGKNLSAVVSFDVKGSMEWRQQYYYGTDNETLLYSARNYPDGNVDYYNPQGALYAEALLARQAFSRELYSVIQNELGRVQPGGYFAGTSYEAFVSEMMSAQAVAALKRLISVAMRADSASFISLLNSPKHLILRPLQEHPFWDSVKDSWIFSGAGIAFGDANDNVVIFYCDLAALNSPAGDASAKSAVPVLAHELKHIGDFSAGYDRPHTEWRAYQVQTDWMRRMGFPIRDINRQQWLTDRIPDRDFAGPAARLATGEFSKDINPKTGIAYTYPEAEAEVMAPLNSAEQFLAAKFPGSSSGLEYLSSLSSSKPRYGETIEGYDFVFRANGQQHSVFVDMSGEWIFYNGEWQIDAARMAARLLDRNGISREQYAAMIDWDARVTAGFVRLPATYSDFINAGYASQQLTDLAKVLNEAFSLDAVDFAEKYHSIQHIIFSSYSTEHGAGHFYPSSGSIILNNAAYPPGDPAYVWAYLLPLIFHEATHLRDFNGNIYPGPMDFRHSEARAYAENAHWEELFHRIFVYPWNSYNRSRFIAEHIPDNNYDGIVARAVTSDTAVSEQAFAPLETAQQFLQPSANGAVDLKYISSSLGQRDLYGAPVQGYDFVFESNDQQYNVFVDMSGEWIYDGEWQIDAARMAARLLDRSSITRQEYENMRTTIWGGTKTYEQFVAEGSSPAQAALLKQVLNLSFQLDGVNIHEKLTHIKHFIWGAFGGQGKSDPVSGTVLSDLRITDINKLVMLLAHEAVHVKDLQKITSPAMRDYMDSEVRAYREDAHWMELLGYPVDGANQTRFIADHIADNNYEGVVGRVVRDPANEALFAQALRPEFSAQNFFQNRTGQSAKYLFSVLATAPGTTVSGYDFVFEVNGQQHSVFVDMNGEWIFYNGQWQIDAARMAARLLDRNGISAAEYTGMLSLDQTLRGGSPLPSSYEIFSSQTLDPKMAEGLAAALNEAWALGPKRFLETIQSVQHILFFPYDSQRYGTGQGYPLDGAMVINSSYYASLQEDYKAMFLAGVFFMKQFI